MESSTPSFGDVARAFASFVVDSALELLAPLRCASCEERVGPKALFCESCAPSTHRIRPWDERTAGHLSVFEYGGAVSTAIARYKYSGRSDLGPRFGKAMAHAARQLRSAVDVVVPVPLHPRRLVERGYNQAALLAAPIARALCVEHLPRALVRTRDTPKQASLERIDRLSNVQGAFIARPRARRRLAGQRVLLVDDVRTTGATLEECAIALQKGGARQVMAFVLATRLKI